MNYTEDYNRTIAALQKQAEEVRNSREAALKLYNDLKLWEVFPRRENRQRKKLVCRLHGLPL